MDVDIEVMPRPADVSHLLLSYLLLISFLFYFSQSILRKPR